jgi:ketosteroid isomerase-like protein
MSQANLDLVRSIYSDWERGDFSSVEWADPEIEYLFVDGPTPGSWTGLAAMVKAYRPFLSAWEDIRGYADEYREWESTRTCSSSSHYTGRGKKSGLDLGQMSTRVAALFQVRSGKVTRLVLYWDRERAFADLGLVE